jgi:List-Bact-rpt repeat protein
LRPLLPAATVRAVVIRRTLIVAAAFAGLWATPAHAATWCGTPSATDRTPNVLAGYAVHTIYAIPSDGADRFGEFATQIQTDAEQIDGWWRGQDPTRAPRFDLFPFSCGPQLDISSVRLQASSAQLGDPNSGFPALIFSLARASLFSPFAKYLVYYDGAVVDPGICGEANVSPAAMSVAVVFVNACQPSVPYAPTAAHELIHTLGAVPRGAPHECAVPNDGHTCDSTQDVMYPFDEGFALAALILDPGRDDYYGHSGSWFDVQDSPWLVALDRQVALSLTIAGTGSVASDIPGVSCTASCTSSWNAGTQVTLTPTAAEGMRFVRWSGECAGAGAAPCRLAIAQAASIQATFAPSSFKLNVSVTGHGSVNARWSGLVCATRCSVSVQSFEPETLRARPGKGWRFKGWAGACTGTKLVCALPMTADSSARALFVKIPKKKK